LAKSPHQRPQIAGNFYLKYVLRETFRKTRFWGPIVEAMAVPGIEIIANVRIWRKWGLRRLALLLRHYATLPFVSNVIAENKQAKGVGKQWGNVFWFFLRLPFEIIFWRSAEKLRQIRRLPLSH
jgi:hypothetical protein